VGEILMAFIDGCLRNKRAEQKKLLAMAIDLIRTKAAHRDQRSAVIMKTIGTLLFILILRKTEK
jgi:hypothetical protein